MENPEKQVTNHQRELFDLLGEFFRRATGGDVQSFATLETFGAVIRSKALDLVPRARDAFRWADEELRQFYAREGMSAFEAARQLGGFKLALGGSSRFKQSQLDSVTSSLLYADTVLIPDPVLPWLESARQEERFRHVLMLESAFAALHLRPLVDAELPHPAVVVFPSWEKTLEERDEQTQKGLDQLSSDLIARFVDPSVQSCADVMAYIRADPDRFLRGVEQHKLFVAPGGAVGEPIPAALERYERHVETWRTSEWMDWYRSQPIALKVMNGIFERLNPQYHILENSEELKSCPLLSVEQQAHYFRLVSKINSARLVHLDVLDRRRQALIDGFGTKRLHWLSRVPTSALVELRKNNENARFRARLESVVRAMHDSEISETDRVAAELCRELNGAIADHDREMRTLQDRYNRIHGQTATMGWIALGAQMMPTLAPFLGAAAPFAVAIKYGWDKVNELAEKKALSRSLLGVLATARREG